MIFIALGSNRAGRWGEPEEALDRAVEELEARGVEVTARSSWYRTAPFGNVNQPAFVNGVIAVETELSPRALLDLCHEVEAAAGRRRGVRWGPRHLDIDLVAYHHRHVEGAGERAKLAGGRLPLMLPHPGLRLRPFVLVPLREIAPHWRHPFTGETAGDMLRKLGPRVAGSVIGRAGAVVTGP
jgi:2-amino-4-hydroxy-6-hydroxymethyldihydropteridine diphosphokinase